MGEQKSRSEQARDALREIISQEIKAHNTTPPGGQQNSGQQGATGGQQGNAGDAKKKKSEDPWEVFADFLGIPE